MPFKSKKRVIDDESGDEGAASKRSRPAAPVSTEVQHDAEGNAYWELSAKRRVAISEFKGANLINIREYYEKDGKSLPGSKGISLSVDQLSALITVLPQLEVALQEKGEKITRPDYESAVKPSVDEEDDDDDGELVSGDKADGSKKSKLNHEATSDEDEDGT